jgi:CxxC motif-containing protein (DUF1111 family)
MIYVRILANFKLIWGYLGPFFFSEQMLGFALRAVTTTYGKLVWRGTLPLLYFYKTLKKMKLLSPAATSVVAFLFILTGCGGGGQSTTQPTPIPNPTPVDPVPNPILDHSGLTPLTAGTPDANEYYSGGEATVKVANEDAFSRRPAAIIDDFQLDGFFTSGDHLFRTPHKDIGPLLSTGNCQGCHLKDGKGKVPASVDTPMTSMFMKIGKAGGGPDPVYGDQLQTFAVQSFTTSDASSGLPSYNGSTNGNALFGEAYAFVEYQTINGTYPDGQAYQLQNPVYKVKDLSFGPFGVTVRLSPRLAPAIFGSGLLEAIPGSNIHQLADENDDNNDGISGRVSLTTDVLTGEQKIGRFSYKAQNPSVLQQISNAYRGDIGLTNKLFPQEACTELQPACQFVAEQETQTGNEVDFSDRELALVEFYNRVLAVPARRGYDEANNNWDDTIVKGRKLFFEVGCVNCHVPRHKTATANGSVLGQITLTGLEPNAEPIAALSNQLIFPYTDLLLHDMGGSCEISRETAIGNSCSDGPQCLYVQRCEGLADGLTEGVASGTEWKTPALWGVGLVQTVNPQASFLHDGRARTLEEAILWHGGEAQTSNNAFQQLTGEQRQQLLGFVGSL